MSSDSIIKPRAISGFPEWLPNEKRVEDRFISTISQCFESYGFTHIETAAIELTEVLASKGVDSKEIYSLQRYHAEDDEASKYSLHFDLTVPFARYTVLNQGKLVFPFKRYQIQKVWRGERPAQGRFREFYQCDIDVVGIEQLPLTYDAEMLEVIAQVFSNLDIGTVQFRLNHRKLLEGFYSSIGLNDESLGKVLIEVDKLDKIKEDGVRKQMQELSIEDTNIDRIIEFASKRSPLKECIAILDEMSLDHPIFIEGKEELKKFIDALPDDVLDQVVWDGSITRGLNYYTGTIFETTLVGAEELGSICSGGRYEHLAGKFTKTKMPGVGISIGLTRLLSYLLQKKNIAENEALSPSQVLITVINEDSRKDCLNLAREIRKNGVNVELASPGKLKKQFNYADRKKIPYVIVGNDDGSYEWKNMKDGEQSKLSREEVIKAASGLDFSS